MVLQVLELLAVLKLCAKNMEYMESIYSKGVRIQKKPRFKVDIH